MFYYFIGNISSSIWKVGYLGCNCEYIYDSTCLLLGLPFVLTESSQFNHFHNK